MPSSGQGVGRQLDHERPHLCRDEVRLWLSVMARSVGNLWRLLFSAMMRQIEALGLPTG